MHIRHPSVEIPSVALGSQLCFFVFLVDRSIFTSSSHFAVHSDGGLTDMSLNRDSAFLVEDRYVEWRYMNRTFTVTTDGVA